MRRMHAGLFGGSKDAICGDKVIVQDDGESHTLFDFERLTTALMADTADRRAGLAAYDF